MVGQKQKQGDEPLTIKNKRSDEAPAHVSDGTTNSSPDKGRAFAPFLAFLLVGFAVHLLVHQLNFVNIEGFPLGFYLAAQAAPILLATIAFWIASRRRRDTLAMGSNEPQTTSRVFTANLLIDGLSVSGELLSGAFLVALTGVLFAQGYDGLAYLLGVMCALIAMSLFIIPARVKTSSQSISKHFQKRFASPSVSIVSALVLGLCLILLLAAELSVLAILLELTLAFSFQNAIALAAVMTLAAAAIVSWKRKILTIALAAGALLVLIVLTVQSGLSSLHHFGFPIPQFSYGHALHDLVALERSMLENEIADPVTLKQHLRPRLHFDAVNFFAIVACLAFGISVLPMRTLFKGQADPIPPRSGDPRVTSTRSTRTLAWGALFVSLILITLPALAAFTKLDLYQTASKGLSLTALPSWAKPHEASGLIKVCGQTDWDAPNLKATCTNSKSERLSLHDIAIHPDAIMIKAPEIANQPQMMTWILGALISFVAFIGGARLLFIAKMEFAHTADALKDHANQKEITKSASPLVGAIVFFTMTLAAAIVALSSHLDTLTLIAWSASLAAATLFPVVVFANLWPRISAPAVVTAIAAGAAVWAYYSLGTTYFAPSFALTWQAISSAPQWQLEQLSSLMSACTQNDQTQCQQLTALGRECANWLGIQNTASAMFALPVALFVLGVLTMLFPVREEKI